MKIKKVQFLEQGFKGIKVSSIESEKKGGRYYNNKMNKEYKHPVHIALETKTKDLRVFLLEMCGVLRGDEDKMTKDYIIAETEIESVELTDEGFIVSGCRVVFGNKYTTYTTPKMSPDVDYHHFGTVMNILKEILEEVKVHVEGTNKASDQEVLIRYIERYKDSGIDVDTIKGMTPEQQKETLTRILEKMGACVIFNEELVEDTDISQELDEVKAIAEEVVYTEPLMLESPVESASPVVEESSDIVIPISIEEPIVIKKKK